MRRIHESFTVRLEITRRAELAIRALALLTGSSERVKASALAESLGTTVKFVPQVLGPLVRAGWVQSDPGPTGGYRSQVDVGDVSVLQVIEAVDGATDVGRCVVRIALASQRVRVCCTRRGLRLAQNWSECCSRHRS